MNSTDLKPGPGLESWEFQLDNPNLIGWTVVAFYVLAAIACAWAAIKARRGAEGKWSILAWWTFAVLLLFLGVNKQLNLQTLMIVLGRRAADAVGWYVYRRMVQAAFAFAFGLALAGAGWVMFRTWKQFFSENALARCGLIILAVFVLIRASTIDHLDEALRLNLYDDQWCWILEICGSAMMAYSAFNFARRCELRRQNL
jgi:hypothetical protein